MAFIKEANQHVLRERFAELVTPVRLLVFTEGQGCQYCRETRQLVEELAELSERIELEILDRAAEPERAQRYGVDKVPAVVLLADEAGEERDTGIRFFGIPAGYEFTTLVDDIVAVSRSEPRLAEATERWLKTLEQPVHMQVFVTPTCPYCPRAVSLAHRMALANPNVRADMVEALEFPELAERYQVYGVPRTVVNGEAAVEGALPEREFVEFLEQAIPAQPAV